MPKISISLIDEIGDVIRKISRVKNIFLHACADLSQPLAFIVFYDSAKPMRSYYFITYLMILNKFMAIFWLFIEFTKCINECNIVLSLLGRNLLQ